MICFRIYTFFINNLYTKGTENYLKFASNRIADGTLSASLLLSKQLVTPSIKLFTPGWQLSPDNAKCLDVRLDSCYNDIICTNARPRNMTKQNCCCSYGKSWGKQSCDICPAEGMVFCYHNCSNVL